MKLVVQEVESGALQSWLAEAEREPVTCDLTRTELVRAVRRVHPDRVLRAHEVLDVLSLTAVSAAVSESAGRRDPPTLRSLDAVHRSSALDLADDLEPDRHL